MGKYQLVRYMGPLGVLRGIVCLFVSRAASAAIVADIYFLPGVPRLRPDR